MKNRGNIIITIFLCVFALFTAWSGISNYRDQLAQQEWPVAKAYVTEVESYRTRTGAKGAKHTEYNISYQFDVGMETYGGTLYGKNYPMDVGDTLELKYDPDDPNTVNDITYVNISGLVMNLIIAYIMVEFALLFSGVRMPVSRLLGRIFKRKERDEKRPRQFVGEGYPLRLTLMGIADETAHGAQWIPLVVGLFFAAFGFMFISFSRNAFGWLFVACAAVALAIYIIHGIAAPIILVRKYYMELGDIDFYRTVNDAVLSTKKPYHSEFMHIMGALARRAPHLFADEE